MMRQIIQVQCYDDDWELKLANKTSVVEIVYTPHRYTRDIMRLLWCTYTPMMNSKITIEKVS